MVVKSNGWLYYLGGPAKDQGPYDMLKPVVKGISGFSLQQARGLADKALRIDREADTHRLLGKN